MNIVLVRPEEVEDGVATLSERASAHVVSVLRKKAGETLRLGIENGARFDAQLLEIGPRCRALLGAPLDEEGAPPAELHLLVAVPRPKAVSRLVQTAASLGITSLTFFEAWRVDKAYFASPRLDPERLAEDALLGAEQGGHTRVPSLHVERGFRVFFREKLKERFSSTALRLVLDPRAAELHSPPPSVAPIVIAFGPEGGFIERELETLNELGFAARRLGTPILTTEIAVAVTLGQLTLLRQSPA